MRAAKSAGRRGWPFNAKGGRSSGSRLALQGLFVVADGNSVAEERNIERPLGVGGHRRGESVLAQGLGELAGAGLELHQAPVLGVDLGDASLELAGRALDLLERFAASLERLAALAQLRVDLRRDGLVPQLELARCVLEDDAQLRDQHAAELLHELRLRQAQRQRQAEVLDVVAFDELQFAREALELERAAAHRKQLC